MASRDDARRISGSLTDPRVIDPRQELVRHDDLSEEELAQVMGVLDAVRQWREAEQRLSFESRSRMKLNETDMKALRYLVAAKNQRQVVTPGLLSEHLSISTAATTKLLDRLAAAGHIERAPHPTDRRAVTVTITRSTHEHVRDSVGRLHARRFEAAAALTPAEREVVIRFLDDLGATGADAQ